MEHEGMMQSLAKGHVDLVRGLVASELDRRVAVIDDLIVAQYQVRPDRHTADATAALKVAVLDLVRSPLADLERRLGVGPEKPADSPAVVAG